MHDLFKSKPREITGDFNLMGQCCECDSIWDSIKRECCPKCGSSNVGITIARPVFAYTGLLSFGGALQFVRYEERKSSDE